MSEGHPAARDYTLAHLWSEYRLAKRRLAGRMQTETLLFQAAGMSLLDSKAGHKALKALFKELDNDG